MKSQVESLLQNTLSKLDQLMPEQAQLLSSEVKQSVKVLVQDALHRMNVVSREEFDAQVAVLSATQARLAALEKQLLDLQSIDQ